MIRKLDPVTDRELFQQAWGWYQSLPKWAHDVLAVYSVETFDEYMEMANGPRTNIGIFDDDKLMGMITVDLVAKDVYELHLASMRRPKIEPILEAFVNLSKVLFEELKAQMAVSFTPSYDKGILALVRAAGMRQDGVEKLKGVSRNKIVKWTRSIITADDYARQVA